MSKKEVEKKIDQIAKKVVILEEVEKLKSGIQKQLAFHQQKVQQLAGSLAVCEVLLKRAVKADNKKEV